MGSTRKWNRSTSPCCVCNSASGCGSEWPAGQNVQSSSLKVVKCMWQHRPAYRRHQRRYFGTQSTLIKWQANYNKFSCWFHSKGAALWITALIWGQQHWNSSTPTWPWDMSLTPEKFSGEPWSWNPASEAAHKHSQTTECDMTSDITDICKFAGSAHTSVVHLHMVHSNNEEEHLQGLCVQGHHDRSVKFDP